MIRLSPAKVNLGLRILRKRADGFHDLHSVMLPVPFYDILEILPAGRVGADLTFTQSGIIPETEFEEHLCVRAFRLFAETGAGLSVRMHLHKQIPVGAGLGGGSSNAATVLTMLNDLSGKSLDENSLHHLAAKLGSDCPFFLLNKTALMEGRGEKLTGLQLDLSHNFMVIVNPGIHISTAEAYGMISPDPTHISFPEMLKKPEGSWKDLLANDFEKPLFKKYPQLEKIRNELFNAGAFYAAMSGSGSSVFGLFEKDPRLVKGLSGRIIWQGMIEPIIQIL